MQPYGSGFNHAGKVESFSIDKEKFMASTKKASSKPGISRSRCKRNEAKKMNRCVFIGTLLLILWTMAIRAKAEGHLFRIGYQKAANTLVLLKAHGTLEKRLQRGDDFVFQCFRQTWKNLVPL
jgi:hypothetical protein